MAYFGATGNGTSGQFADILARSQDANLGNWRFGNRSQANRRNALLLRNIMMSLGRLGNGSDQGLGSGALQAGGQSPQLLRNIMAALSQIRTDINLLRSDIGELRADGGGETGGGSGTSRADGGQQQASGSAPSKKEVSQAAKAEQQELWQEKYRDGKAAIWEKANEEIAANPEREREIRARAWNEVTRLYTAVSGEFQELYRDAMKEVDDPETAKLRDKAVDMWAETVALREKIYIDARARADADPAREEEIIEAAHEKVGEIMEETADKVEDMFDD